MDPARLRASPSADPAPPSSRVDSARVKTTGRRRDSGDLRGGELVLQHPWSSRDGGIEHASLRVFHFHLLHRRKERPLPIVSVVNLETTESHLFFHSTNPVGEESYQDQQHHQSIIFPDFGWTLSCYLISPMCYCIICV
ncbi:hypothetical protein DAI22_10g109300 [Oryza sativa Japonica Group]|nr:hypothetical protein DAI22_10g109300 [Oryza sativa Japonica Group]